MSDFRKPRPDIPIVPQSAIVRKVNKPPKRPKGRKGRKPKGKPTGQFVSRQDPNYLLRKAEDEARQAREDRRRRLEQEERQIQLQIEDRRDRRVEARRADALGRQQLQLAQARFAQDAAVQREQLRLQGEAQQETARFRVAQLTQAANQSAARAAEAAQIRKDNFDIYGVLQRLYRQQERREGENLQLMRDFLTQQSRRVQLDPVIFRTGQAKQGGTDIEGDIPFGSRATADQRRQRRNRSRARSETPQREPEPEPEAQAISDAYDSIFGSIGSSSSSSSSSGGSSGGSGAEEVLSRARSGGGGFEIPFQPRILRGDPEPTRRFQIDEGATEEEIAEAGGIAGQTPRDIRVAEAVEETTDLSSDQLRDLGGGSSGSEETIRRGAAAGRRFLASTLVRGASRTEEERERAGVGIRYVSSGEEEELGQGGSLIAQYFPEPRPEGETRGIGRPLSVNERAKLVAEQRRADKEAEGLTASQQAIADIQRISDEAIRDVGQITEERQEAVGVNLRESGVLVEPPSGSESSGESEVDLGLGGFDFSRPAAAAGRGVAAVGGAAIRGATGLVQGVGEGIVEQLPTAADVGRAVGRTGYQGIVAAGGLLQGAARGALQAATADPEIGEQIGGTIFDRRALRGAQRNPASGRQPSPPRTPPPLLSYAGFPSARPPSYSPPTTDSEID